MASDFNGKTVSSTYLWKENNLISPYALAETIFIDKTGEQTVADFISSSKNSLSSNQTSITGFNTRLGDLEGEVETNTGNISSLQTSLNDLKGKVESDNSNAGDGKYPQLGGANTFTGTNIFENSIQVKGTANSTTKTVELSVKPNSNASSPNFGLWHNDNWLIYGNGTNTFITAGANKTAKDSTAQVIVAQRDLKISSGSEDATSQDPAEIKGLITQKINSPKGKELKIYGGGAIYLYPYYEHATANPSGISWVVGDAGPQGDGTNGIDFYPSPNTSGQGTSRIGRTAYPISAVYANRFVEQSDKRLKENISDDLATLLEVLKELRPVTYNLIKNKESKVRIGFLAQEVEQILAKYGLEPESFSLLTKEKIDNEELDNVIYGLDYTEFIALNTAAIQKQQQTIDELAARLENLEARL